jgi:pyruvate/2-oxoglutarate dehydrogenase complex dihydrolipoamide dehydrogenase (E3) component
MTTPPQQQHHDHHQDRPFQCQELQQWNSLPIQHCRQDRHHHRHHPIHRTNKGNTIHQQHGIPVLRSLVFTMFNLLLMMPFLCQWVQQQQPFFVDKARTTTTTHTTIFAYALTTPTTTDTTTTTRTKATKTSYDLIVVGGGSAGLTAAKFASGVLKKSVLIVEQSKLGGDCTWTGCIPSKSLIASARAASMLTRRSTIQQLNRSSSQPSSTTPSSSSSSSSSSATAAGGGVAKGDIDFAQVCDTYRTNQQLIYDRDDSPTALDKYNIDTVQGTATLISPTTVQVVVAAVGGSDEEGDNKNNESTTTTTTTTIAAKQGIVLCTGATPNRPTTTITGLADIDYVTYEEVWDLPSLPPRLTIVGGGPIGCELAQAFARLGSCVTIVVSSSSSSSSSPRLLLPKEDPIVSTLLQQVFEEKEGITIIPGRVSSVIKNSDGTHTATVSNPSLTDGKDDDVVVMERQVIGDVLLISTGRNPNTEGLGLETIGVLIDDQTGGIIVNDKLQTSVKNIYAAGDCTGDRQFTHYAGFQGAIAARNILLPLSDPGVAKDIPSVTFTSPEIASVGYTEQEAIDEYGADAILVSSMNLDEVDRAVCDGETIGIIKVVYKKRGGKILGATIMAPVAGELISEIVVAMKAGMPFPALSKAIHPYPSYAIALQIMAANAYYEEVGRLRGVYEVLKRLGL